jgi:hypothetical protein
MLHPQVEDQIYYTYKTYLIILNNLTQNLNNIIKYQTEEISKYQIFTFTSIGPLVTRSSRHVVVGC